MVNTMISRRIILCAIGCGAAFALQRWSLLVKTKTTCDRPSMFVINSQKASGGSDRKRNNYQPELPFDDELLKELIEQRFNNPNRELSKVPLMDNLVYDIEQNFILKDRYWIAKVRPERFDASAQANVLYRPEIVDNLMKALEDAQGEDQRGIMVKGPPRIGKSFSIVNLVLHLMSTGKYLVTFFPDCNQWRYTIDFLTDVICASCFHWFNTVSASNHR